MKKILAAIDFSLHTQYICDFATELALLYNAEITLFHTYYDRYYMSSQGLHDTYDINAIPIEDSKDISYKQMSQWIEYIKNKTNKINVKSNITNINFEEDLKEFCNDYHPSLVLLGSKGRDSSSFIFGSTAIRVFNKLKYPVIAVPVKNKPIHINNIMYIIDNMVSNDVLIRKTYNLFENNNPHIYSVNLAEDENYLQAYNLKEEIENIYLKESEKGIFNCDVLEGNDKHEEIDKFIEKNKIDIIAFMPHKENFFQRLIGKKNKNYLFETNLPILALRN